MIRILFFVAVILTLGLSFAWLADRPGELILTWQGQRLETSLLVGIAAFAALLVALMLVVWLARALLTSPESVRRHFRRRKRDRGYDALSRGLIAAGAGDALLARQMTRRTRSLLSVEKEPLVHVLEAQTFMIEGRHDDARAEFEAMAENPETRPLGLRGLYLEARRLGASEAAQHYAERAVEKAPHLPWAGQAALEYRTRDGKWDDAIRLLQKQRASRLLDRSEADRKRAVLLTARARGVLESNPRQASMDAQEAVRLAPRFVPAAVTAAKALFRLNDLRRGSKILEKVWKSNPHPEVADAYVRARAGDSVQDRLKRARRLDALKPNHIESLRIVAQAALDAHDHALARQRAEAALRLQPRESLYLLLAEVEEADTGDQGRVRHWMGQALRAPRDPAWTADGYVSEEWAPLSPVTGTLDAFVWKVPVEQLGGPRIDQEEATSADADEAIRTLPPARTDDSARPTAPYEERAEAPGPATGKSSDSPGPSSETSTRRSEEASESAKTVPGASAPAAAVRESPRSSARSSAAHAVAREAAPVERAEEEQTAEERGAVIIPLPQPARGDRADAASVETPAKGSAPTSFANLPATVPEPPAVDKAKRSEGAERSAGAATESGASTDDKSIRTAAVDESDDDLVAGKTAKVDVDRDRENRFLTHRIDDPGVKEKATKEKPSASRFRLF